MADLPEWLGDTEQERERVHKILLPMLRKEFGHRILILQSAALTGRLLWTRTRNPADYPPIPKELREIYYRYGTQGRVEVTTHPALDTIPGVYLYDMRFAYAASCGKLPHGEVTRTAGDAYGRYVQGRYRIAFEVPADWSHIGIFPVAREKSRGVWYPSTPLAVHETWASNTEIALASEMGWIVAIHESITYANEGPGPLDVWRDKLVKLYMGCPDKPVRDRLRDMLLHTIGRFNMHRRDERRVTDDPETMPADARQIIRQPDGSWSYVVPIAIPAHELPYAHPEWSNEVWSRCRTRLLRYRDRTHGAEWGALTVPREHVLGIRSDAIYLSHPADWRDYGDVGNMRLKGYTTMIAPAPRDAKTLRALVNEPEEDGDDAT